MGMERMGMKRIDVFRLRDSLQTRLRDVAKDFTRFVMMKEERKKKRFKNLVVEVKAVPGRLCPAYSLRPAWMLGDNHCSPKSGPL
jgi:hypothetical protein